MDLAQAISGYVVLTEERNPLRAYLVAGAVDAAGIPVHVEENNLADEFAMSQKLMGIQRVRVLVPRERFLDAQTVFLAMSQPIPRIEEEVAENDEGRDRSADGQHHLLTRFGWIAVLALVGLPALVLALAWILRIF